MTSPQQPPKTILGQVTQAIQTIQAKVNFNALALKPNAKVPELWVQDAGAAKAEIYPMLGDRYLLGRSSKSCDIVIRNPVVSQVHLSVSRDPKHQKSFIIKDENSTNGIYRGRRRLQSLELRHGDILTLGPPELADAVRLQYHNPPPLYVLAFRYSLYGAGALVSLIAFLILYEWRNIPVRPLPVAVQGPVIVNSDEGTPLQRPRTEAHRELRRLSDFSKYLPAAVLASEDSRYHWHFGVDPIGTLRAVVTNVKGGGIKQGGSTLTQQLARSLYRDYVGTEDSAGRKIREAIVALKLETFYSKDEILRNYMNRIYLGVGASGFEDAAQFYFEKSARDLDISEAATLVAILPAPNSYNPIRDYKTAVGLRDRIITRMVSQGRISAEEGQRARRSRIEVSPKAREALANIKAPYFYSYVFTELRTLLGEQLAKEGNFIVETNLDLETQQKAETSLRNSVNTSGSSYGFSQGAIVTLDSSTGAIRALVGGTDYEKSQFNRATQAKRQPGSTFKVFAYASALEQGNSPGKFYSCAPLVWQNQRFRACERVGGSGTDMYTGIAQSENVVALRVAQDVGLNRVVEMAQRLGITTPLNPVPGLVLGQSETTLLEMTGAFAAIENNGVWNRAHAIKRILDSSDCTDFKNPQTCRVIYSFEEETGATKRVLPQGIADTMNVMLRSVVRSGTGRAASIGLGDEAGKTGTTNSGVDLLFIGYVPSRDLVTGVWLGNDDNSPTRGSSGQAAQVWANYMRQVVR
ncbi:transglycosylase domain-containing protein [Funiculus sociatus GB2-A5]|uniref:Transglycosylase domain-containing protein n=1 Tax=Funiculus sociatus GB2-A5 TaxID=2933946 RepID=A0ABV0JRM8_9CYAN|nr:MULTISPECIES: transglycosylase domain-containing protein [unclassified Trichocoleus]MBD1906037.1 transglycosylase domain-containing protein [Trichocoleus sp. FACHB-832]MBD2061982.1 transglycosylase domain-containing protein [Trichocoleus sp. FACHB-6]